MRSGELSQSARALRQAGAGPEGKVRLVLCNARSGLKSRVGDFKGKYLVFSLLKSQCDVGHGFDPLGYGWLLRLCAALGKMNLLATAPDTTRFCCAAPRAVYQS